MHGVASSLIISGSAVRHITSELAGVEGAGRSADVRGGGVKRCTGLETADFTNACSCIHRRRVFEALAEFEPRLLALFAWSNKAAIPAHLTDGTHVCSSQSGARVCMTVQETFSACSDG